MCTSLSLKRSSTVFAVFGTKSHYSIIHELNEHGYPIYLGKALEVLYIDTRREIRER